MFFVNKQKVTTVASAMAQFTEVVKGITEAQKMKSAKAQAEIDIAQTKLEEAQRKFEKVSTTQSALKVAADKEVEDAEIMGQNLLNVSLKGTSQEVV